MTRAETIKKIKSLCHGCVEFPHCVNTDPDCFKALEMAIKALSAEPLTDKEQRIFLSAMGREEKVCREVDAEHPSENYEDTLLAVCRSITRKVKGALWK